MTAAFRLSAAVVVVLGDTREAAALGAALRAAGGLAVSPPDRRDQRVLLVDARHPYDASYDALGDASDDASRPAGVAAAPADRLRLLRPEWPMRAGDRWISAESPADARARLRPEWRTVLLTLGRDMLGPFAGDRDRRYLVRVRGAPSDLRLPLFRYRILSQTGPYTEEGEAALLTAEGVQAMVSRNDGGEGASPKIAAARRLGLPVLMLARPRQRPGVAQVATTAEALAWIAARSAEPAG